MLWFRPIASSINQPWSPIAPTFRLTVPLELHYTGTTNNISFSINGMTLLCSLNGKRFSFVMLSLSALLAMPLVAIASQSTNSPHAIAQTEAKLTTSQILNACIQNQAKTLPNPFTDVSAKHWAFKAVLTVHYCGAYRQATPSSLLERLTKQQPSAQTPQSGQ